VAVAALVVPTVQVVKDQAKVDTDLSPVAHLVVVAVDLVPAMVVDSEVAVLCVSYGAPEDHFLHLHRLA
jgi:hypothetical protein